MSRSPERPFASAPDPEPRIPPHTAPQAPEEEKRQLEKSWKDAAGILGRLKSTDHKVIGKRYVTTAFVFFLLGGLEALAMRIQLARPENGFLNPDVYNQVFTMHGTTMMFLFAVPVMEGLAIYLVPLMVGTRNVAFPKLNAFGYWIYTLGGLFLYAGFFLNRGGDAGWFAYVPLSGPEYSPSHRVDIWANMITFTEVSALAVAVEVIVTAFKQRAPGMSLNRVPLFVWSVLVSNFMVIFAMPSVMMATAFLALDRLIGTHFYNAAEGGDPLLYQHLFWFFGHPEVYIIFIPALGMVSTIIPAFTKRPVFGYTAMVLSLVATAFLGFGLWVHHMFATGLPQLGESFFTVASMMIAIPSGIQIFCWIRSLWGTRPRLATPMLFVLGFFFVFVIGGLTGVMLASVPFDLQTHDTYFVVGHFHYVLIGGAVFPLLGAIAFWFPKATGRMLSERLGRWTFALVFLGFNATFFPLHWLGFQGMPRRVYTYIPEMGWGPANLAATIGAGVLGIGVLLFLINAFWSARRGRPAGDNPWGAATLEWATSSPPPAYNFPRIPVVPGPEPLWDENGLGEVTGMRSDRREILVTRPLDAEPHHRDVLAEPSIWPLFVSFAVTVGLVGTLFTPWAFAVSALLFLVAMTGWYWPKGEPSGHHPKVAA